MGYEGEWNPDDLLAVTLKYRDSCEVCINGAEILLNLEYLKSVQAARQTYIFTNGKVFTADKRDRIVDALHSHGISTVRISNHFGAFSALNAVNPKLVCAVSDRLINSGFIVDYNTTITTDNYLDVQDMCKEAYSQGVKRIKFFLLMNSGRASSLPKGLYLNSNNSYISK